MIVDMKIHLLNKRNRRINLPGTQSSTGIEDCLSRFKK